MTSDRAIVVIIFLLFILIVFGGYCIRQIIKRRRRTSIDRNALQLYKRLHSAPNQTYQPPVATTPPPITILTESGRKENIESYYEIN